MSIMLNHATIVLNPEFGSSEQMRKESNNLIKVKLRGTDANGILANTNLDL